MCLETTEKAPSTLGWVHKHRKQITRTDGSQTNPRKSGSEITHCGTFMYRKGTKVMTYCPKPDKIL